MESGLRSIPESASAVRGMGWRWYSPRAGSVNSGPVRSLASADQVCAREVEVLAFALLLKDVQQADDGGGRGDFLAQFAGQGSFQVFAGLDAAAGQHPVGVFAGADATDGQQIMLGCDQQGADAVGHAAPLGRYSITVADGYAGGRSRPGMGTSGSRGGLVCHRPVQRLQGQMPGKDVQVLASGAGRVKGYTSGP